MNQKILINTLIVGVLIIGIVLIWRNNISYQNLGDSNQNIIKVDRNGDIKGEYSLMDIISIDEGYECVFDRKDGNSKVKGKIYIAPGSNVRGDFAITTDTAPNNFDSHFISINQTTYTWTSLLNVGFKASITVGASSTQNNLVDIENKIEYDCKKTEPDRKLFELPPNIIFKDIQ